MRYFLGDVRDLQRLKMAMTGVDIVIHAAAVTSGSKEVMLNPVKFVSDNVMVFRWLPVGMPEKHKRP